MKGWVIGIGLTVVAAAGLAFDTKRPAAKPAGDKVGIEMKNVELRMADGIKLEVRQAKGRLVALSNSKPVTLDDVNSFRMDVDSATMAIGMESLAQVLNAYVFAYEGAPLKKVSAEVKDGRLVLKGTMHKVTDLPFELEGSLSATPDGNIQVHADHFKSVHIPFKGLLHLFGEDLSKLVNVHEARGVRMEGDNIILYPSRMMPPPHINGKVTAARVEGESVVEVFGGGQAAGFTLPEKATNFMYHRGGVLRFGKLTMSDTDLEIIDENPGTPFDFSLQDYNRQLVAGYSKNTASHGLVVHMPDYGTIGAAKTGEQAQRDQ